MYIKEVNLQIYSAKMKKLYTVIMGVTIHEKKHPYFPMQEMKFNHL